MSEALLIIIRSITTFFSLLIFSRVLGKTQISHLTFFEYIAGITLGSIAGALTTNLNVPPWPIFLGMATWTGLTLATQWVALWNRRAGQLLDGEPVLVIRKGQILERNLRSMRMRYSELYGLLRNQGIFDLNEVDYAIMETAGTLSVLKRSRDRPVTPADLHLPTSSSHLPHELIVDGQVINSTLDQLRLPQDWLMTRLRERGIASPGEVFLAVMDSGGSLYLDTYQDRVPPAEHLPNHTVPHQEE